jgi:hypothetical protein
MTNTKTYSEKLQHPKWQEKRLGILNRDEFTCQYCGDTETMLHVHHIAYSGDPWTVDDKFLITLCSNCHKMEEEQIKEAIPTTIKKLKEAGFMSISFDHLPKIFKDTDRGWVTYEPSFDIIKMIVDDDELWESAKNLFWDRLNKSAKEGKNNG